MVVRSTRLISYRTSTAGASSALVYTCPADRTVILKHFTYSNFTTGTISLTKGPLPDDFAFWRASTPPAGGVVTLTGQFVVLLPTNNVYVVASANVGRIDVEVFGALLWGVAPP